MVVANSITLMNHKTAPSSAPTTPAASFSEDDIRSYAQHLYEQSGRIPGRDLDNWFEAKACLEANIPRHASHRRLQHHLDNGRAHAATAASRRFSVA
jgi:hypothetical protein